MEVAILVGLPASGKSTFYRERLAGTHELVSKDLMPNVRDRARRQVEMIERALREGRSVAVDNTNPTRAARAAILEQARRHGARVVAYYFPAEVKVCLARNRARDKRVPEVAIFVAAKKMQPPAADEGFDDIVIMPA